MYGIIPSRVRGDSHHARGDLQEVSQRRTVLVKSRVCQIGARNTNPESMPGGSLPSILLGQGMLCLCSFGSAKSFPVMPFPALDEFQEGCM